MTPEDREELGALYHDYELDPGPNAAHALSQRLFGIALRRILNRLSPEGRGPLEAIQSSLDVPPADQSDPQRIESFSQSDELDQPRPPGTSLETWNNDEDVREEAAGTSDSAETVQEAGRGNRAGEAAAEEREGEAGKAGTEEALGHNVRLEVLEDILKVTPQVTQPPRYFDIREGSIAERYRKGRLDLVAELHVTWQGKTCDYLAVLQAYDADKFCQVESDVTALEYEGLNSSVRQNGDEQPVLVRVVEELDSEERVIPSLVRFHLPYEGNGPRVGEVYVSLSNGLVKGTRAFREGELNLGIGATVRNEGCGEVVQRGAQIMDGVSDDRREMLRNLLANAHGEGHHGTWVRAWLKDKSIRLSVREVPDFSVEIADVLLGPC
jgi:hypothetical protein